jgi:hypothetical protein
MQHQPVAKSRRPGRDFGIGRAFRLWLRNSRTGTKMSSKEQDFKERLVAVMRDLKDNGTKDPEAVWMIGSLATRLVDLYRLKTWTQFKAQLSREAYDQLLRDFEQQGNGYHKDGKAKAAYAIQLLAISVVAQKQADLEVRRGNQLLDDMINRMIAAYRKAQATQAAKAH